MGNFCKTSNKYNVLLDIRKACGSLYNSDSRIVPSYTKLYATNFD